MKSIKRIVKVIWNQTGRRGRIVSEDRRREKIGKEIITTAADEISEESKESKEAVA